MQEAVALKCNCSVSPIFDASCIIYFQKNKQCKRRKIENKGNCLDDRNVCFLVSLDAE